jgi:hypothetical protein
VSAEQLRRWILEGRANAHTQVLADGSAEWKPLGSLPDFAAQLPSAAPPPFRPSSIPGYRKTNAYAMWGMICGIVSVVFCLCCCLNVPLGAVGLVFSLIGLSQINEFPELYEGRAVAIVGIVVSALGLLLGIGILLINGSLGNLHVNHNWYYHQY